MRGCLSIHPFIIYSHSSPCTSTAKVEEAQPSAVLWVFVYETTVVEHNENASFLKKALKVEVV